MSHGEFSGAPKCEWLTENDRPDRQMRVLEEFTFRDSDGRMWRTPTNCLVDGASIPRALWTLVGSPFTGDYRRASIVHDKACDDAGGNPAARRAADRMFYHACRAGGCSVRESTLLYVGVRMGALSDSTPIWREATANEDRGPEVARTPAEDRFEVDFRMAAETVLSHGEVDDPAVIERRTDVALSLVSGVDLSGR
jgi:Protein of unknown function (DUF1353)